MNANLILSFCILALGVIAYPSIYRMIYLYVVALGIWALTRLLGPSKKTSKASLELRITSV